MDKLPLNNLLRYGYGGFLAAGLVLIIAPYTARLKQAIDAAGSVIAPLVLLAFGAAIYVLYRYVIGELLLYPLTHVVHHVLDRSSGGHTTSPITYLKSLGVPFGFRRAAYTRIRRELLPAEVQDRLSRDHTEAHVLWLTAVIVGTAAACYSAFMPRNGTSQPAALPSTTRSANAVSAERPPSYSPAIISSTFSNVSITFGNPRTSADSLTSC